MKIYLLFSDNFPSGSAYANRIHSLAKGLTQLGNQVEVSIVYPGAKNNTVLQNELLGIADSVKFRNYSGFRFKPHGRLLKNLVGVWGIVVFALVLIRERLRTKIDHVILCSSSLWHIVPFYLLSKLCGYKLLREKNEFPLFVLRNKKYFAYASRYKMLDGFIFMTHALKDFFTNVLKINKKNIVIPMTVDLTRFAGNEKKQGEIDYITLVGDVLGNKDGAHLLIQAFAIIHKSFPKMKLKMIGDIRNTNLFNKINDFVNSMQLSEFVEFSGLLPREDIPGVLKASKLLVLPRPSSKQAEGGFPTKLGEYLASGVPVVVTNTGEISRYLKDKIHAYIVKPDDYHEFAKAMIEALSDYQKAMTIGKDGQLIVHEVFNYEVQALRLHDFLLNF